MDALNGRIVVLAGGLSHERDVSLRSGRRVAEALRDSGAEVDERDVDASLLPALRDDPPMCVLPLLHGETGEDGALREVLELVDLQARANHRPAQLSGGQQQRVAVARAVVADPKLILADEPTGNLDTKNGDEVMEMLATLNREGATVLMVTHSATYAEWAHRIVYMLDGRIVSHAEGKG
ncbi:MAG TPA: ATP-binding cassette domain-containing protein, partial [Nocardioidaceae bacterium]|nr:ATP-binding cassette domain-containing protein [Nocardioidaceae bacterium]